jgi:hypothetical protein
MKRRSHQRLGLRPIVYVTPPDAPPLDEVVRDLFCKSKQLGDLNDQISAAIAALECRLRALGVDRILTVKLPDGAELGWSFHRKRNEWRFVIRTEDDAWELRKCSADERCEVFLCGAMGKIVEQVIAARKKSA